ncbi:hypothetical protein [Deinococcus aerolatus]|nr:hypothetical protein [Deinococcus aerolatus]
MTFFMLALLPAAVALCLLLVLALSVVVRTVQGERWSVTLENQGPTSPNLQVNAWMTDTVVNGLVRESVA